MKKLAYIFCIALFLFGCTASQSSTSEINEELIIDNNDAEHEKSLCESRVEIDDFTNTKTISTKAAYIAGDERSTAEIQFNTNRENLTDKTELIKLFFYIDVGGFGNGTGCLSPQSTMMIKFTDGEVINLNNSIRKTDCGSRVYFFVTLDR